MCRGARLRLVRTQTVHCCDIRHSLPFSKIILAIKAQQLTPGAWILHLRQACQIIYCEEPKKSCTLSISSTRFILEEWEPSCGKMNKLGGFWSFLWLSKKNVSVHLWKQSTTISLHLIVVCQVYLMIISKGKHGVNSILAPLRVLQERLEITVITPSLCQFIGRSVSQYLYAASLHFGDVSSLKSFFYHKPWR